MTSGPVSEVLCILCAAANSDARVRVPALQQLQELEGNPGLLNLLLEAYASATADPHGRLLAIMLCKNVVDRHWQPRSGHNLNNEEKTKVKAAIINVLRLAVAGSLPHVVELTILVRRICRFEFPRNWDELTKFLVSELQHVQHSGMSEQSMAVIIVLHHVMKEQATKKLLGARKDFHQIGQVLMEPVGLVWSVVFQRMQQDGEALVGDDRIWKLSRYLDGSFSILMVYGVPHLHESPAGPQMVVLVRDKLSFMIMLLRTNPQLLSACPFFLKNLKSLLKWLANLVRTHPLAFAQANLAKVLDVSVEVLQAHAAQQGQPQIKCMIEGLLKSSLRLLTNSFGTLVYRRGPQPTQQGVTHEAATLCHAQFAEFVNLHPVGKLCELCCRSALSQEAADVQEWLSDPEDQLQGPGSLTELNQAGQAFINELGNDPFGSALIQHIAQKVNEDLSRPLSASDPFEVVIGKDALLMILSLCQPLLKSHLHFQQLLSFASPIVLLTQHLHEQSPSILLPVRLCAVLKSWTKDIPPELMIPTLQILGNFIQESRPKAVRLAVLGPLRAMLDRFSDHDGWAQIQDSLIDACLALLVTLHAPEVQWRCLSLIHLFLVEEAESGRYEVTDKTLQRLLMLWKQPEGGELLIPHALLDVLRAMVLMSCWSKQPRLRLPPALLTCCLTVISDCFSNHKGGTGSPNAASGFEASAALQADADAAARSLGDFSSASTTLFDSGSALLLGILRTVDTEQAAPLIQLLPPLVAHYGRRPVEGIDNVALEILIEYCALHASVVQGPEHLQPHFGVLLQVCRCALERDPKENSERCLQILQLLVALAATPENVRQVQGLVNNVFQLWTTSFNPQAPHGSFSYSIHALMPVLCSWQSYHDQHFRQQVQRIAPSAAVAARITDCCKFVRPVPTRAAMLASALSLVADGSADITFWQAYLGRCDELIESAQKQGSSALKEALEAMKTKLPLSTKLPVPARSTVELHCSAFPADIRQCLLQESCTLDESALIRWLFARLAQVLQPLAARASLDLQALRNSALPRVQAALQACGI